MKNSGLATVLFLGLFGCNANQDSLQQFVLNTESSTEPQKMAARLIQSSDVVRFQEPSSHSPFSLPKMATQQNPERGQSCWQPKTRTKQGLELYRINELQVKGIMSKNGKMTGLVMLPNRRVVKVEEGHFLGENNGQIKQITENALIVGETLPDGLGCWYQRQIKLALK
ncbi:pilus assembly protein PilP [Vibrio sp. 10N]|uniref:pilus assembly protein PilP n=1 Tax=Vibrio sp. 10N TaxID=3058938 RepID=UPI0028145D15|nr:pilus assembly protein PilP [Vibrio sp. 10N]